MTERLPLCRRILLTSFSCGLITGGAALSQAESFSDWIKKDQSQMKDFHQHKEAPKKAQPKPKPPPRVEPKAQPTPKPVPQPKPEAKAVGANQPNRYAVLIGIGDYHSGTVSDLPHSVTDVGSIHKALTRTGYADENIIVLTDDDATIGKVRKLLGTKVPVVVGENDSILVYFAGHGAAVKSARSTSADGTEKYLLFADSRIGDLYGTALTMSELGRMFKRMRSNRLIFVMDTSYTIAMRPRGCAAKDLDDDFLDRLARKGSVVITASKASEASLGSPALGYTLFSHHVAGMLSGAGDLNGDKVITLDEGYRYLTDSVAADAESQGGSQHPVMKGELQGDFPLAQIPE